MTTTTTQGRRAASATRAEVPRAGLVTPPKLQRRPALMAAGVAAICLGALLAAWAFTTSTNTREVLAARVTIHRGDLITAADLERVRISADSALTPLPGSSYSTVIGQRAALDVAGGSLLTTESTSTSAIPGSGRSVVGIQLTPAQLPAFPLQGGDLVRVVVTPGQNGTVAGTPLSTSATVADTQVIESTGNTVVDVVVPYADAGVLAARAATGDVALVLDSGSH